MKEKEVNKEQKRKILSLFLLFFPTLIIAVIPSQINTSILLPMALKGLLAFYQFIALKNFLDTHYGE